MRLFLGLQIRRLALPVVLVSAIMSASGNRVSAQPLDQLQLPPRPAGALTGTQFKDVILNMPRAEREVAIYREVAKGNIPDFMRTLKPVSITATIASQSRTATFHVLPDYLAIGSDSDYFRMPMTPILAQWTADIAQCSLPTRKMVGAIWTTATCKLAPSPISPSAAMVTVPVFWDHQVTVQSQRNTNGATLGALVAGHKKDVVISPQLVTFPSPKRVAIYGWHQLNGSPIQPLYFGHEETYADYSHGVRLVNGQMTIDGVERTVSGVLQDSAVASLLSDEASPFTVSAPPRYNLPSPAGGGGGWTFTDEHGLTRTVARCIAVFACPRVRVRPCLSVSVGVRPCLSVFLRARSTPAFPASASQSDRG